MIRIFSAEISIVSKIGRDLPTDLKRKKIFDRYSLSVLTRCIISSVVVIVLQTRQRLVNVRIPVAVYTSYISDVLNEIRTKRAQLTAINNIA